MIIGPFVNGAAILTGSIVGVLLGTHVPRRISERLPLVFGCVAMSLGVSMIVKVTSLPPVVIAVILGTILGEIVRIEKLFQALARLARRAVSVFTPKRAREGEDDAKREVKHTETFISATVLFCFSGVGILGSLTEGMTGDTTLLLVKAIMDWFTALVFAISLGLSVAVLAIPQTLVQVGLFLSATLILPLTTPAMVGDFSACGGIIMIATGLTIAQIKSFPLSSMLVALILVMPFSAAWTHFAP